jgi:hypothetical protein
LSRISSPGCRKLSLPGGQINGGTTPLVFDAGAIALFRFEQGATNIKSADARPA